MFVRDIATVHEAWGMAEVAVHVPSDVVGEIFPLLNAPIIPIFSPTATLMLNSSGAGTTTE